MFKEIEFLQASLSQLKSVQQKFVESLESVTKVTQQNEGADVLVPLSSSVSWKLLLCIINILAYIRCIKISLTVRTCMYY